MSMTLLGVVEQSEHGELLICCLFHILLVTCFCCCLFLVYCVFLMLVYLWHQE